MADIRLSYPDIKEELFWSLYFESSPHSLLSIERFYALFKTVIYIVENNIPGAIAECGVYKAGASHFCAKLFTELGDISREWYWFDTFNGFPEGVHEVAIDGSVLTRESWHTHDFSHLAAANFLSSRYPEALLCKVVGPVEETLPKWKPAGLAMLHLDTDYYESTRCELEYLYPHLVSRGVLIVDDYGHFAGVRRAIDEYFEARKEYPLFLRTDYTGRICIKG